MAKATARPLARIRTLTAKLNTLTDEAAATVNSVEETLNACKVGTPTSVLVSTWDDDEDHTNYETLLAYRRSGSRFRIIVSYVRDQDYEESRDTPWAECDQTTKLLTIERLPSLLERIAAEIEERIVKVTAAVTEVRKYVDDHLLPDGE